MNTGTFNKYAAIAEVTPCVYSISVEESCDWDIPDEFDVPDMDLSVLHPSRSDA